MDEHISQILQMLAEGKISASDAEKLLSALKFAPPQPPVPPPPSNGASAGTWKDSRSADSRESRAEAEPASTASGGQESGSAKQFDFSWGHKRAFPFDLSGLGKQISDAVKKIDPEKLVREARVGVSRGGKRWQDRMREWSRFMTGEDGPPENTLGQPAARDTENLLFTVTPDATIQVANNYGAIFVSGGSEAVSIEIEKEAWASTDDEARTRLRDLKVEVLTQQSPGLGASRLEVRVHAPEDWRDGWANLRIRVPDGASLKLETVFGEIRVESTAGYVESHTISGAITLEGLKGEAHAEAISGDIRAVRHCGSLRLATKSGDLNAEDLSRGGELITVSGTVIVKRIEGSRLEAKSVSGDVFVDEAGHAAPIEIVVESVSGDVALNRARGSAVRLKTISGDVSASDVQAETMQGETVSGDLSATFDGPFAGMLTTNTVSGDVAVKVSAASSFRFTLGTQSGDLTCRLPTQNSSRIDTLLSGVVGAGDGTVTIHTRSGDVTLEPPAE